MSDVVLDFFAAAPERVMAALAAGDAWPHGSVELPCALVHPSLAGAGPIVTRVPVVPAHEHKYAPGPTGVQPLRCRLDRAWIKFASMLAQLRRLAELDAPEIIMENGELLLQARFEELCAIAQRSDALELPEHAWEGEPRARPLRLRCPFEPPRSLEWLGEPEGGQPLACLWLDDARVLVQIGGALLCVDVPDARVHARYPLAWLQATSLDVEGSRVLCLGRYINANEIDDAVELDEVAVLDLRDGSWLREYPPTMCAVLPDGDQPEDCWLTDWHDGRRSYPDVQSDRPGFACATRDHRFLWVHDDDHGHVLDTRTGLCHIDVGELDIELAAGRTLALDGSWLDDAALEQLEEDGVFDEPSAVAIATTAAGSWRVLTPDRVVHDGERALFRLGFVPSAAAFDPKATQLLLLTADEALCVSVSDDPRVVWRWPQLEQALAAPP